MNQDSRDKSFVESIDPDGVADLDAVTIAPMSAPIERAAAENDSKLALPERGTVIDQYEIVGEVARGAMGVVFRAKHAALGRDVAIKMMLAGDDVSAEYRERFANEARAAAALDHPGIVPVFSVGQWHQRPYFAMALVDGESLAERLRDGPLTSAEAARIAKELTDAIGHAHEHQIIHRDLKPANILIDRTHSVRVTDFGVSKLIGGGSEVTQQGELIGTPHYMPPEQAGGSTQSIGPAADVYSIGAVLYAMVTGRPPFQAASPVDVVMQVISREPVPPSALNASVPADLEVITLKCLSKSVADRYASADELSEDLRRFIAGEPILAKPPGWIRQARMMLRTHVLFASVSGSAAMLLVLMTAAVLVALFRARNDVLELQDQLDRATLLLTTERRLTSKYISASTDRPNELAEFEINRLATSASGLQDSKPELSIQLALAAIDLAGQRGLAPPAEMIDLLRERLRAGFSGAASSDANSDTNPTTAAPSDSLPETTDELVQMAKQRWGTPLSETERQLYGIQYLAPEED
ncbi:serine/threonine-protein kinase [Stieleria varia]|uniref:non-specific serine/threonine protein kinase n=1 Tax=Stieleria varia TaxID=2528005 RepID=A0A5C6AXH2_9BACT|nr:serine/threonine-protein kinase [Stieleria varia]TWU04705.1 Serine/threonine-protein kinase PknB [Stieleria varia]